MKKHFLIYMLCILLAFPASVNAADNSPAYTRDSIANNMQDSLPDDPEDSSFDDTQEGDFDDSETLASSGEPATTGDAWPADAPAIDSSAAIVMDLDTGAILYRKNAYDAYYPASITKVMTALVALEQGDLSDTITMSAEAVYGIESDSANIALDVDEQISLQDALYALLLASANEAALGIAEHIGGSVANFSTMMNQKAQELGCVNSNFVNPNGLHDDNHYVCAYDMALIGMAAYEIPEFREMVETKSYTIPATNKSEARELWNSDYMLFSTNKFYYEYCIGGKTGFTNMAKGTLVTYAEKDGKKLICVALNGAPSSVTFYDTANLLDYCYDNYTTVYPLADFSFDGNNSGDSTVLSNYYANLEHSMPELSCDNQFALFVRNDISIEEIQKTFIYYDAPENGIVGRIEFSYDGEYLGETDIYSESYVPKSIQASTELANAEKSSRQRRKRIITILLITIFVILFAFLGFLRLRKLQIERRRRRIKRFNSRKMNSGGQNVRRK